MSSVITVENLGKRYTLKHQTGSQPYVALRDVVSNGVKNLGSRLFGNRLKTDIESGQEDFWALKDISFKVKQGDRIGIIGRNGAGKSTLLKILSRITEPTTGSVRIKGRVASLLEVGTGFHSELTGRENIFLNGAILGMSRGEIKKKFDEIIDFAEIEKFLDTPVKRYSSGMYVRLAFAVAAHLEPEILVVDEVLAVGDAQFQKKCLGKMEKVAHEGRTILFVSHNMGPVRELCSQVYLLEKGVLAKAGSPLDIIDYYLNSCLEKSHAGNLFEIAVEKALPMQLTRIQLPSQKVVYDVFEPVTVAIDFLVHRVVEGFSIYCEVSNGMEVIFVSFDTSETPEYLGPRNEGNYHSVFTIPAPLLKPGEYMLSFCVGKVYTTPVQTLKNCLTFSVEMNSRSERYASYAKGRPGLVAVPLKWETYASCNQGDQLSA